MIGVGNLGNRHLESLLKVDLPISVTAIDSSRQALETAHRTHGSDCRVTFTDRIEMLPNELDFAVIATSSKPRRSVTEALLAHSYVRYLLLEKALFPRVEDYYAVSQLLSEKKIKAWVNCARRMFKFYQVLKEKLSGDSKMCFSITGGEWGMGCNAVHMLDLIAFLTGSPSGLILDTSSLDVGFISAKRTGYIEFTGLLTGSSSSCPCFVLNSVRGNTSPMIINIQSENNSISIHEYAETAIMFNRGNNWRAEQTGLTIPYQSQLTGPLFEELISSDTCNLTLFEESVKIHVPMIEAFLGHYQRAIGREEDSCPIT